MCTGEAGRCQRILVPRGQTSTACGPTTGTRSRGGVNPGFQRATDGRPYGAAAVPLLILTGCRNREILNLRWGQVDLEAGDPRLADTTTGPRRVALSPWAVRVPKSIPRLPNSLWVISGMVDTAGLCRRVPTVLHRSRTSRAGTHGWLGASTLGPIKPTRVCSPTTPLLSGTAKLPCLGHQGPSTCNGCQRNRETDK